MPDLARLDSAQMQAAIRRVGRQQWWLRSTGILVSLALTMGIASFAFPGLLQKIHAGYSLDLGETVRILVGLVLIFNLYAIYQQLQIHRVQLELGRQIAAMDKIEARNEEVYKMALLDPLTGLYNRRCGEQRLAEEISRAARSGLPLTVMMFDLNKLKYVNDTFGHAAGDEMIRQFAHRMSKATRGSDLAVRLGGDEFLLVLPECRPGDLRHVLARMSNMKMEFGDQTVAIDFAVGWANYTSAESVEEFLERTDKALYANKRAWQDQSELDPAAR